MYKLLSLIKQNEQGQSFVELALVLPLIILLLFGCVEFGRVFHSYLMITNAAREGARAGALGQTYTEVENKVKAVTQTLDRPEQVSLTITPSDPQARKRGVPLTVEVSYQVDILTPLLDQIIPDPLPISAKTIMRVE